MRQFAFREIRIPTDVFRLTEWHDLPVRQAQKITPFRKPCFTAAISGKWSRTMYDAIIVGARCAGASTAMLLARKGHKVLLVDRSPFPTDIPHGHLILRHGPKR